MVARSPLNVTFTCITWIVVSFLETFVRDGTDTPISKRNESSLPPSSFLGRFANNEMQAMRRRQGKLG
jgi:hypothetical protein